MQNVTLLLERYKRIHDKAVMAFEKGDLKSSRTNFLHAAEIMYEIANKSPERLKEIRLAKAKALILMAENKISKSKIPSNNEEKNQGIKNKSVEESLFKPQKSNVKIFFRDIIGLSEAKEVVKTKMILPLLIKATLSAISSASSI